MNCIRNFKRLLLSALLVVSASFTALADAPVEKDVVIFGQKIHYVEAGSGPTVILLHGLGGSSQVWQFNIGVLAEKFRVIVPDQIGFGKSDKPLVNYRIRTYVDFLDQFCKQLEIARASLVGNSMGGWVAAHFAAAFPDRVDKLVLVDAGGYAPPKDFDTRVFYDLNPTTREGMKVLSAKVFYNKLFLTDTAIDQAMAARLGAGDGFTIKSITESIIRAKTTWTRQSRPSSVRHCSCGDARTV
jgi:pimeloyl-ACP methyl ester carboxylesterase